MKDGLPPLREVVAAHGLAAKKTLGQNFLFDLNLTARIARAAGPLADATIVEIGPGPGRLDVIEGDAVATNIAALVGGDRPARICANLPYNIATVLLTGWLETKLWPPVFDRFVLMFQKEVAQRIVATPKERADYGRLSVLANWRCTTRILFDVPRSAFTPPPKVTSSIVELVPRDTPLPCDLGSLSAVTRAAFGQRRKMLRQSLKGLGVDSLDLLADAGLDATARAEEIDIAGFIALANALTRLRSRTA
jgi:16S rRNA (adenine1518-N6/adenine1519-N6)-dimethyltransferase